LLARRAPPPPSPSPRSLHDALPIFLLSGIRFTERFVLLPAVHDPTSDWISDSCSSISGAIRPANTPSLSRSVSVTGTIRFSSPADRKSTRLNSSHVKISYAVFHLKQ